MSHPLLHLDTSFLIRALDPSSSENDTLRRWLEDGRKPAMSSIAWAEFLSGPLSDQQLATARAILSEIVPFTAEDAATAAQLFNSSGRKRRLFRDCLIAASAVAQEAEIATSNRSDFQALGVSLAT